MPTLIAIPLDKTTRPAGLTIISPELTTPQTKIGNQGTSTKTPDIAPCTDLYASASRLGKATLSSSRNRPRDITRNPDGRETIEIGFLERHPYSSQAFMPMGGINVPSYVVVVASALPDGSPDLASVQAVLVRGDQGISYAANTWHAPMASIRKAGSGCNNEADTQPLDFCIFQYLNGVAEDDCEMITLVEPLTVVI